MRERYRPHHVFAAVLLSSLALAAQSAPPAAWDGVNPFRCELQQPGLGTEVPHPDADPYCVEFDKTHQNVADGGVADFLANEPARVAAASPKCFYFQSDHWRGSVVQDDATTKTYEWDGHYYFDKATGDGGVWVSNFNFHGQTFDPSSIPGIPPETAAQLGPGTGGVITHNQVDAEPDCVAEKDGVYADTTPEKHGCVTTAGPLRRRRLGPVRLGMRDRAVRARLGAPREVRRGFLRYCADGGGALLIGQRNDRSGDLGSDPKARTVIVVSTARAVLRRAPRHSRRGVLVGRHRRWVAVSRLHGTPLRTALRRAGVRVRRSGRPGRP
ncbi:MAG: hypothetical protein QOI80_285 [Solirubrobacteraceae bacterium]|nr:hypothetical protein [Solirubrobacteraceae bacterium]